ncbi:hypothetical protein MUP32_06825 [Candidatus Microgenomates bacterium]|nr:hypothetical protein [Candidatus Microgenomates bacterium]
MKWQKVLFFLLVLPFTLGLDFLLYAMMKSCPNCSSFTQWLQTEGALSYPFVAGITIWFTHKFSKAI